MPSSTNLILPYLEAAQAQKHVTVNEAIRALDALVHLSVKDRNLATPPGSPADGDRYLVALSSATGAWATKEGKVAVYQDGGWAFLEPREGWVLWVEDEDVLLVYNSASWVPAANAAATVTSTNGAATSILVAEEEITVTANPTDSTFQIPNGAILLGVSSRVTQALTGTAANWQLGISGEASKFGGSLNKALGSTNFGIIGPTAFYSPTAIRVSAPSGTLTGGKVRIAVHYFLITVPAS
jgi:hypothetical protein